MDTRKAGKLWSFPLNSKTCKYYAISHFINPEKTWNAYFKAMKSVECIVSCIEAEKFDDRNLRKIVSIGNEISQSFSKEATTRMVIALVNKRFHSDAKTLLEWLGLYWKQAIPEANLENTPWSIELADRLQEFRSQNKG